MAKGDKKLFLKLSNIEATHDKPPGDAQIDNTLTKTV